jgi:hypothetical protein
MRLESDETLTFRAVHLGICSQVAFTKKLRVNGKFRNICSTACSHPAQKSSRQPADQGDAARVITEIGCVTHSTELNPSAEATSQPVNQSTSYPQIVRHTEAQ